MPSSTPAVRERGILFQGHLIDPIQRDLKTVTRRTQGLDTLNKNPDQWTVIPRSEWWPRAPLPPEYFVFRRPVSPDEVDGKGDLPSGIVAIKCPYGVPGDRLWVRENLVRPDGDPWLYAADKMPVMVAAEDETAMLVWAHHRERDYCPSIHMPRWASRITLENINVRAGARAGHHGRGCASRGCTTLAVQPRTAIDHGRAGW